MEADKALIDYSEKHRYACGARHTEDLTNLQKRGGIATLSKFFKSNKEETEAPFLISRPKPFGLEDTTRRKIQFKAVKIRSIRVELNHRSRSANRFAQLGLVRNFVLRFSFIVLFILLLPSDLNREYRY